MSLWIMALAWAETGEQAGMITIEVVEDPSLWDYAGEYGYLAVIAILLAVFLWRKYSVMRKS